MSDLTPAELPVSLVDLPSPALLVDEDRLDANIAQTAAVLREAGVDLRPHVKTSKSVEVAGRQVRSGAIGHTCSTPSEVMALTEAGHTGLLWAHLPIGPQKASFAARAAAEHGVILSLDSVESAEPVSRARGGASEEISFVLEVDTGQGRSGVLPDEAESIAEKIAGMPGMSLRGVLTHEGHLSSHGSDREALDAAARASGSLLVEVATALRAAGHECATVSVGSTPGLRHAPFIAGVTEARPGTYVYFDANQLRLGSAELGQCAQTVLTRVVSTNRDGTAIIDAGLKAMSADALTPENGAGIVCDLAVNPVDGIEFWTANEEHGFLRGPGAARLRVGDVLRVIPNHACGTTNMWSVLHLVRGQQAQQRWDIRARH